MATSSPTNAGADPSVVGPYLAAALDDERWAEPDVDLIAGGKSNLTYLVRSPAGEVVLRRPPLGQVLATAHDMRREHRVIAALGGTDVPVPQALHLCTDESVLGAPFYVMSKVDGHIARESLPEGYADEPAQRRRIAEGLVSVLAQLHAVDAAAIGLGDFGKPEGYLARQVRRWGQQWEASRSASTGAANPELDALMTSLADQLPVSGPGTVVHGDYRLDNTVLDPTAPGRIAAVLDWEMSTLGDPLADLGLLLVYWSNTDDNALRDEVLVVPSVTALPGFLSRAEVVEAYAAATGRDTSALPWYVAFGFFKLAVVCAGIVARVEAGAMVGGGFDFIASRIPPLIRLGRETLSTGDIS